MLLLSGCDAIATFGDFKFASDAGVATHPKHDAGDALPLDAAMEQPPAMDAGAKLDSGGGGGKSDGAVQPKPDAGPMGCAATSETDCNDRVDNDCDGLVDCDDPNCGDEPRCCKPNEIPETSCSGGRDNDCDGLIDCKDPNCSASPDCCVASGAEVGNTACSDGVDNDCDGLTDCQESACAAQGVCCQATPETDPTACGDGLDNDCDGKSDCADADCSVMAACCTKGEQVEASCGDAKDNDCDGLTDCRDPDCNSQVTCAQCMPMAATESSCTDLKDNDCDKDRDCLDSDCGSNLACCVKKGAESGDAACINGVDDDCDGQVDCSDPECSASRDCCVASLETGAACSDKQDNDCDSFVDCMDPDCAGTPTCCVVRGTESGLAACADGVDNDCDTLRDCGDPDCQGSCTTACMPSGAEAMQPNDGRDNDCDGLTDIPIFNATYPMQGVSAAGREVAISVAPSIIANAALECSIRRLSQLSVPLFTTCPGNGNVVSPHSFAASADATNDGAWVTDVRWRFPDGTHSQVVSFKYYIHHTLHTAKLCGFPAISDGQWIAKAAERLAEPKPAMFKLGTPTDTVLVNPFVRVTFQPSNANSINLRFQQDGTPQTVEMWSLRRRFVMSMDNRFLLILRNYASSRSSKCFAAHFRYHNSHHKYPNNYRGLSCDAIVLNRAGAGVCLNAVGGKPEFASDSNDILANKLGWQSANKFMWRQLVDEHGRGEVHDYHHDESLNYRNFTPKCSMQPCTNVNAIYLPDRALFP